MEVKKKVRISLDNPSIQRINSLCINCGACFNVCERVVGIDHSREKEIPSCINCGACILTCPKGAIVCKYNYKGILNLVKDTNKLVAISIAPAVRGSLGEELGLGEGVDLEGLLPSILRKIGFDYVFDVTFGADVTVVEEAMEFLERLKDKAKLPMFTSCCPAWVKYASMYHPELLDNLSTTKSPIGIQSTLIKTYFREMNDIKDDIISVVVAPCTAKKYEILNTDTDYCITTRELAYMIKECKIDIDSLKRESFDALLSYGSKAGCMFGRSGGVMEAVLSTAYYLSTGKNPEQGSFYVDNESEITKVSYKLGDRIVNAAVVTRMPNLEKVIENLEDYDIIEVMNCKGGCVGGGGQPLGSKVSEEDRLKKRASVLNNQDNDTAYSYQNRNLKGMYDCYMNPKKSKELLHTRHEDLSSFVKNHKN